MKLMLLVIGGEKGGTGKTTIATNLAAMRVLTGRDVLLVDTDRQSSASFWAETRQEQGALPPIASVQKFGSKIRGDLLDLAKRYQDVIVDAGGQDSPELRAALTVADAPSFRCRLLSSIFGPFKSSTKSFAQRWLSMTLFRSLLS